MRESERERDERTRENKCVRESERTRETTRENEREDRQREAAIAQQLLPPQPTYGSWKDIVAAHL